MDEPFSAVDPVVRHELQNEILRLQSELRKTIVFVTHDIDEALKLADQVAVFGRGGVLQQYDEPARLLSRPANDFVAKFIGLGRGYRWLQLIDASGLPMHDMQRIAANSLSGTESDHVLDGWTLVVTPRTGFRIWGWAIAALCWLCTRFPSCLARWLSPCRIFPLLRFTPWPGFWSLVRLPPCWSSKRCLMNGKSNCTSQPPRRESFVVAHAQSCLCEFDFRQSTTRRFEATLIKAKMRARDYGD